MCLTVFPSTWAYCLIRYLQRTWYKTQATLKLWSQRQKDTVVHGERERERERGEREREVSQWSAVMPISPLSCLKDLSLKTTTFDPEEGVVCWLQALSYCRPTHVCIWIGMDGLPSLKADHSRLHLQQHGRYSQGRYWPLLVICGNAPSKINALSDLYIDCT